MMQKKEYKSYRKKAVLVTAFFLFVLAWPYAGFSQHVTKKDTAKQNLWIPDTTSIALDTADYVIDSLRAADSAFIVNDKNEIVKIDYIPDTVFLKNGDKITGKILAFQQGRLIIDGQDPGVVKIKWHKIAFIKGGNRLFKVEDTYGIIYIGHIRLAKDTGEIIVLGGKRQAILLEDIARMYPLETKWYRGIKGDVGGGVNYTKSSDVLQINLDYNLYYVVSRWRFINYFSYLETTTKDEPATRRVQFDLQALYALPEKWMLSEINSYNRNDELGIKARFSVSAGWW
jgi:hypothetical protein